MVSAGVTLCSWFQLRVSWVWSMQDGSPSMSGALTSPARTLFPRDLSSFSTWTSLPGSWLPEEQKQEPGPHTIIGQNMSVIQAEGIQTLLQVGKSSMHVQGRKTVGASFQAIRHCLPSLCSNSHFSYMETIFTTPRMPDLSSTVASSSSPVSHDLWWVEMFVRLCGLGTSQAKEPWSESTSSSMFNR